MSPTDGPRRHQRTGCPVRETRSHRTAPPVRGLRAARTRSALRSGALLVTAAGAAGAGQLLLRRGSEQLQLAARAPAADLAELLTALAAAAAGALLLWLVVTGGASALALVLRSRGRAWSPLDAVERRVVPALVRRAVAAGLGASAVVGLAAPSALAAPPAQRAVAQSAQQAQVGSAEVGSAEVGSWGVRTTAQAGPVPAWPAEATAPRAAAPSTAAPPTAAPPSAAPPPTAPPPAVTPRTGTATGEDRVVVGAGDSLWSLTEDHLGPHATDAAVAAEWPRWWAANREVVGDDPDLVHPGQVLQVPGAPR